MVGGKVARRAVAVSLDPINLWGGLWRAVRVSTASRFLPRVGFLVAIGGHRHAGGGGGDGGGGRLEVVIIEGVGVIPLEGFLATQAVQGF